MNIQITHISAATTLLEIGSLRLLTDPVFDPPGGKYYFGWGTGSTKLTAPSISIDSLGSIDAVLLSHDHHEDNLDKAGRAFLPKAKRVLTTTSGEKRLHGNAEGMADWQSTTLESGDTKIKITATPAQHGNLIARPFAGQTIGFMLEWEGQQNGAFYITGDTIYYRGIDQVAERFKISVAMFHLGRASFPITGPIRFTMDAKDGVRAAQKLNSRTIIPIHYEGWKHFVQGREAIEKEFAAAGLKLKLHWLNLGEPTEMAV
ncbi:MAG TPA: MBL fold metallo-hydrolase [Anaerolineales bacterium]|nr:MBL fold metallo-hydrolase [Anaerolineales bacterium]HUM27184.1 MBL fold metallo-hydrolase [Anaerolineales bacterium]